MLGLAPEQRELQAVLASAGLGGQLRRRGAASDRIAPRDEEAVRARVAAPRAAIPVIQLPAHLHRGAAPERSGIADPLDLSAAGRRAELTAAGTAFLASARDLPALTHRAAEHARRAARGEIGQIALKFTASSAFNPLVPAAIRDLRLALPAISVSLFEANSRVLVEQLASGALDAAFLRPGTPGAEVLNLRPVCAEPMVAALARDRAPPSAAPVALETLAADPLLLFPRSVGPMLHDTVIDAFHRIGVTPRLDQTAPQIASVINLVAAGMGFSLVPETMAAIGVAGVSYHAIAPDPPIAHLSFATRRGDTNPIVRRLGRRIIAISRSDRSDDDARYDDGPHERP